jgi:hypothetical protein|tara:strand:+ start:117 stop:419 length:303 start_codon:yes stop_codon:yes gene_type:complete
MNRYKNIDRYKNAEGRRYYTNAIYPEIPEDENDIYFIASAGDRYDKLALQYYGDKSLWWIIASSNNHQKASLIPSPGEQIRIPVNTELALRLYQEINSSR